MDRAGRIAASKKLSRYKLHLQNGLFWGNVIWCRTAYSEKEGKAAGTPNQHTFYELHYVLGGEMEVSISGGEPYRVGQGGFVLIPPRCTHLIRPMVPDMEKFVCGLTSTAKWILSDRLWNGWKRIVPTVLRTPCLCMWTGCWKMP